MKSKLMNTVDKLPVDIDDALGDTLYGSDGKTYLDWFADVGTVNLGYKPSVLYSYISRVSQHIPNTMGNPFKEKITERLCEKTKMSGAFYCNSGSEANEAALKIVRKSNKNPQRNTIYTVKGGFHGRTYGAMSLSDSAPYHKNGFYPIVGGIEHFETIDDIDWNKAQAVFLATGFGNNDVGVYDKEFICGLRQLTEQNGIPLVLDEVQVGAGRTGTWNMYDYYGIIPDIVCLGKGIGAGIPTGVTLATNGYESVLTPGTHYSTFGGSPLSLSGIKFVLDSWENGLPDNIKRLSDRLFDSLNDMKHIFNIRGKGLWIGFDVEDEMAKELSMVLLKNRMFLPTFRGTGMKITPMLNSAMSDIDYGLCILGDSIRELFGDV